MSWGSSLRLLVVSSRIVNALEVTLNGEPPGLNLGAISLTSRVSEFNHIKDANDNCVLVPGTEPLPNDESCNDDSGYWYDRTAYRKIPYSTCEGGQRLDRGTEHICPGFSGHSWFFWLFMLTLPFGFTALVAYYYYRRSGLARGYVCLLCGLCSSY